jgi:hypothetical protein
MKRCSNCVRSRASRTDDMIQPDQLSTRSLWSASFWLTLSLGGLAAGRQAATKTCC